MSKILKIVVRFVLVVYATLQKPEIAVWPGLMNLFLPNTNIVFVFMYLAFVHGVGPGVTVRPMLSEKLSGISNRFVFAGDAG